jgi:hypothetical protein
MALPFNQSETSNGAAIHKSQFPKAQSLIEWLKEGKGYTRKQQICCFLSNIKEIGIEITLKKG